MQASGLLYSFSHISINKDDLEDINNLLRQLSNRSRHLTAEQLSIILKQPNFFLWATRSPTGHIVAMATLIIYETFTKKTGIIEDVVVDENHRNQGLRHNSIRTLIIFARVKGLDCLDLTSTPDRIEANNLYQSLGFKKRDTNYYRLTF